jgi:hypothetical protein
MLFVVTCLHAAKYLPTVRRAVPWYIWPLLAVASAVKALPVDFGVDEVLFTLAFALIAWRLPGCSGRCTVRPRPGSRRRAIASAVPRTGKQGDHGTSRAVLCLRGRSHRTRSPEHSPVPAKIHPHARLPCRPVDVRAVSTTSPNLWLRKPAKHPDQ